MDRVKAFIEGGQVERLHGTPRHLPYTVAQHSWNMAALLYRLHPNPSTDLIWVVLFHDVAERWVGDTPAPAKWLRPQLGFAVRDAERLVEQAIGVPHGLCDSDTRWLHALDLLELYLFCLDERQMGNRNLGDVAEACVKRLVDAPTEIRNYLEDLEWKRCASDWNT